MTKKTQTQTLIQAGIDSLVKATEKHGDEVAFQIAAAQAAGVLAIAAALAEDTGVEQR